MTVDEELNLFEDGLRKLKVEYESYFNGGSPRPPNDLVFRVEKIIKKYSAGGQELSHRQRFRFNQLNQSYAVHSDLWRKRTKMKEEGGSAFVVRGRAHAGAPHVFRIAWSEPDQEKVEQLLQAVQKARAETGEPAERLDPGVFANFIRAKTAQLKSSLQCETLSFSVSVEDGRVKLQVTKAG